MNPASRTPSPTSAFVNFDAAAEATRIVGTLRSYGESARPRRGFVVAMNGDVDSALCAALAVRAVGADAVFGLMLPERESSSATLLAAVRWAEQLGIDYDVQDITSLLEVIGCYRRRDEIVRHVIPEYRGGWAIKRVSLGDSPGVEGPVRFAFDAVDTEGGERSAAFTDTEYRAILAAASLKQRTRAMIVYYHADRLRSAVLGCTDRLQYGLALVKKNGDASADVMPIAHLYRTEVYELARHLGVPANAHDRAPLGSAAPPSRDWTEWTLSLPRDDMDRVFRARDDGHDAAAAAQLLGLPVEQVAHAFGEIERGCLEAAYVQQPPRLLERVGSLADRALGGA